MRKEKLKYISFSRNFGHQYALKAGIDHAQGDCAISMDSDMQHPPELIGKMLELWEQGYEIVYTIRKEDKSLSFFKRKTSSLFYRIFNYLTDLNIEAGAADFRLIDRKVIAVLRDNIPEYELFLRGVIKWVGFKQYGFEYEPNKRFSGKSKYSLKKMMLFALDGITSFSPKPLKSAIYMGLFISFFSFLYAAYAVIVSIFFGKAIVGWTSTIVSVLFIGGIQLLFLGIIGEYLGRVFLEVKNRPSYIIREKNIK